MANTEHTVDMAELEANVVRCHKKIEEIAAKRAAFWKEIEHQSKQELLAQLTMRQRVHAMDKRDSKWEIIGAVCDAVHPFKWAERDLARAQARLATAKAQAEM